MKKLTTLLCAFLLAVTGLMAQTPNQFKYQAVLRDANGAVKANEAVTVTVTILQGSPSGTNVFEETHNVTTTAQGIVNLNIGSEQDLSVVDWSADSYFVEISVNGTVMGTSQLLSVPYAMHAQNASNADYENLTNKPDLPEDVSDLSDTTGLFFDGDYTSLTNTPELFSGNYEDLNNTPDIVDSIVAYRFSGNYADLSNIPAIPGDVSGLSDTTGLFFDGDYNSLTNTPNLEPYIDSTEAALWDKDTTNELQTLSISGDTLFLSQGNYTVLPDTSAYSLKADSANQADTSEVAKSLVMQGDDGSMYTIKIDSSGNLYAEEPLPFDMVSVSGGTFDMGCTSEQSDCDANETPVHSVTVDDFEISKYEITNQQYAAFMSEIGANSDGSYDGTVYLDMNHNHCQITYSNGSFEAESGKENYPVIMVTWYGAKAFCEHYGGRLPTEAEWEFAARGGNSATPTEYAGSNNIDEVAWYDGNSENPDNELYGEKGTHEVGTKAPNELGLYDMSGNVEEWCNDWYASDYYSSSPQNNPQGPSSGSLRVDRGGSWKFNAGFCRVPDRNGPSPDSHYYNLGFRLVRFP